MVQKRAQKRYRELALAGMAGEPPWKRLVDQALLREEPVLEKLSPYWKERQAVTEIPRVQRFAARFPLDRLLEKAGPD
ncbi:MAG: hypothetical protein FJY85_11320 [Deltaproteobacteria bacterium]|nr:hypothetical protein [Deltaproteobacteria bacterium]